MDLDGPDQIPNRNVRHAGISCLVLTMLSFYSGTGVEPLRLVSMTIIAVILEQFSIFGIDNLTVPIVISILWSQLIT